MKWTETEKGCDPQAEQLETTVNLKYWIYCTLPSNILTHEALLNNVKLTEGYKSMP
jgi:hypothetical protein